MKNILGLDLGPTSIGWAFVNQAENKDEKSSIIRAGVRIIPLSADEKDCFEKGKAITTNAKRTLIRGKRRNLQRYKLRRQVLIEILTREGWINNTTILSENGPKSTFDTLRIRAKAPIEEISLEELAKVLLMINKKRGYKSNRKTDSTSDGVIIDEMDIAKTLYDEGITPAELSLRILSGGKNKLPDFYRSDLTKEFDLIWDCQKKYYPEILSDDFKHQIENQSGKSINKIFSEQYDISTADNKGKNKKKIALEWRIQAANGEMDREQMAYVIADIKDAINNSGGNLGAISDRSKNLYLNKITVGQYLYHSIQDNPNISLKNQVFYRQDYLDEFETIWECQKLFHPELNDKLKSEIRDTVIFYQRRLKSQKGQISFCEFEKKTIEVDIDGKKTLKVRGSKVAPRSSLLFQEYKVWCILNNLVVTDTATGQCFSPNTEQKNSLYNELTIKAKLKDKYVLKILGYQPTRYQLNYPEVEGNNTLFSLYEKYIDVINASGHGEFDIAKMNYSETRDVLESIFSALGFNKDILYFDSGLSKEKFEQQAIFKLWHLLYSYEGDNSKSGNESLIRKISEISRMPAEYAKILSRTLFLKDYASLSHKAISKILPYLKEGNDYSMACYYAGYNHSDSHKKEENESRILKEKLQLIPKGSLHNPVVEKVLNQMVNVVNQICESFGKPDEIHIEFARELKQNAKQRDKTSDIIAERTKDNERIIKILQAEFGIIHISHNDVLRYRLYEELKVNGYKTLYSNKVIHREDLFSPSINIEHIIPQSLLFDDSFANKTLEYTDVNIKKGKRTAADFVMEEYAEDGFSQYKLRVDDMLNRHAISRTKHKNLLMKQCDIPSDFVNRDLTNTQYIAKKSSEMLLDITPVVMPTTGEITARLREDWQLVDIMKELNFSKYEKAGLTYSFRRDDGHEIKRIIDWTKRNDHRHHAMDAIAIAFTKPSHIQLLNSLSASSDKTSIAYAIKQKETMLKDSSWIFIPPVPIKEFRGQVICALENVLISIKAKNKVATKNINKTKCRTGINAKIELTPRGELHKDFIYGIRKRYVVTYVSVNAKLTAEIIQTVADQKQRKELMSRLYEYNGDSKKAFPEKNKSAKKVKCVTLKTVYSIRKPINPDLNIEKVTDARIRKILIDRLESFNGDKNKAFSNIESNPIWLNKQKGLQIKRVSIEENFDLRALRSKIDKEGKFIIDSNGNRIPSDYVNLRNNHHVAIYEDINGNYQEVIVSFFEALRRVNMGIPIVDKEFNRGLGWRFIFSMKQNEMFVFPNDETQFNPETINLQDPKNNNLISPNLYRVQKISSGDYCFRHHLETTIDSKKILQGVTWMRITSLNKLKGAVKVRINHVGQIVGIGEND